MNDISTSDAVDRLAAEFVERFRKGERPSVSEYAARCPERAEEIRDLFPALVVMENLKPAPRVAGADQARCATKVAALGKLGDYLIVREIGHGGMGIVYEAIQESLGRKVALKVLPKQLVGDAGRQARFEREARSAARLHHSNIVPVFGVGQEEGLHYYAMQYIHGLSLDDVLRELKRLRSPSREPAPGQESPASAQAATPPMSVAITQALVTGRFDATPQGSAGEPTEVVAPSKPTGQSKNSGGGHILSDTAKARLSDTARLPSSFSLPGLKETRSGSGRTTFWQSVARIGTQVGEALHHAHEQGVLHRDIKPSNLLLDTRGTVWVTDFGLAKADDQRDLTHTGDVLGTLRYMAPEMFSGQSDQRSDVYSLGLTLYELLVLRPAFNESDRGRLIRMVLNEAPPRLRTLDPAIPRDLETIVHKAIDREPSHRYSSALELAEDLTRFLNDEPIRARHVSLATRFTRWCKRNPAVAGLTSTIAVLLLVAAVGSTFAAVYFQHMAKQRTSALAVATAATLTAQQEKTEADIARNQERILRLEAERQRDRANTNYARARRAVDSYLSKVTEEELLSVPGLQPLRQQLLAEALKFYTEFIQEQSDDPQLQIEQASAHFRLGIIHRDLGNTVASQAANTKAIRLLETLRGKNPASLDVLTLLAEAYYHGQRYDDTVVLCQEVLKSNPDAVGVRSTLAETYNTLAINKKEGQDDAAALKYHQQAFEIRQKLASEFRDQAEYNAELASTINNIGVLLGNQNKSAEALAMYQLAVTYDEKACRLAPYSVMWGRWLATSHRNVGNTQRRLGQPQEALQAFQRQAEIWERLVAQNPALPYLRSDYYKALLLLAEQQKLLGLNNEASRSTRDAREVLARLQGNSPTQLFELATVYASLAAPPDANQDASADTPEAADERQRNTDLAMLTLQRAVDAGWSDPAALKNNKVLDSLRKRATFEQLRKSIDDIAEARRLLAAEAMTEQIRLANQQQAAAILKQVPGTGPQLVAHQKTLAETYHSIAVLQTGLKQFADAEKSLLLAIEMRRAQFEALKKQDPQRRGEQTEALIGLQRSVAAQGDLAWARGAHSTATAIWHGAAMELREALQLEPDNERLQLAVATAHLELANRYGSIGLVDPAARALQQGLTRSIPNTTLNHNLAVALAGAGADGDFDRYRELLDVKSAQVGQVAPLEKVRLDFLGQKPLMAGPLAEKIARAAVEAGGSSRWKYLVLGFAQYLNGDFQAADATLAQYPDAPWQVWYARAMVRHQLNDHPGAGKFLEQGEEELRRIGQIVALRSQDEVALPHFSKYWWEYSHFLATRRRAWELIRNRAPPADPWLHMIQARGYRLIGENELAEKELAAAVAAAPSDAAMWVARAGLRDRWGEAAWAEADWQRAVELAGQHPQPWIARGRRHAQRGDREKADADFARASALTNQLNPFLEAGWWVVGPLATQPDRYDQPQAPESNADPAIPVLAAEGQPELVWRPVGTQDFGCVDFATTGDPGLKYAIGYIYSARERRESLMLSGYGSARVWLNGQEIGRANDMTGSEFAPYQRLSATLHPGRNVILIKHWPGKETGGVYLRFPEADLDRGIAYLNAGLVPEAAQLLERGLQRPPRVSAVPWQAAIRALRHAESSDESYRRLAGRVLARFGESQTVTGAFDISLAGGLTAEAVVPSEKLLERAKAYYDVDPKDNFRIFISALALYRAGKLQDARARLLSDGQAQQHPHCQLLLALIDNRLFGPVASQQSLARATKFYERTLDDLSAGTGQRPWAWDEFCILLREAAIIAGRPPADDPRLHLWRARSWLSFEEAGKAQAELRSAAVLAPSDTRVWLAIARIQAESEILADKALLSLNKTIELASNDPAPWIARGRWYAQRGEQEKADADYAKAASLTPGELNRFLEGGWWAIGPYPRDLNDFCPPELDQNPSTPVHIVDPQTGFSDKPVKWTSIPTGDFGRLELANYDGAKGSVSCYVLAHVYSPQETTAVLCLSAAGDARVWVNDQLVYHFSNAATPGTWSRDPLRLPCVLRQGRNTILVKGFADSVLTLRLGDHPFDRGMEMARYGQWKEAADLLETGMRRSNEVDLHEYPFRNLAAFRLAAGDLEAVRKLYGELWDKHRQTSVSFWKYALSQIGTLAPRIVDDEEAVVTLAEGLRGDPSSWHRVIIPVAYARVGRWQDVVDFFAGDEEVRTTQPEAAPLLAMAFHQLGKKAEAQAALARMELAHRTRMDWDATRWPLNNVYMGLLFPREASLMVTGSAKEVEQRFEDFYRQRRANRDRSAHETREFDVAVDLSQYGALPKHQPYLARGRRLAELGRLEEAAADFNQAVALAPNDPDVITERALYLADNGEPQKAAADFDAALKLLEIHRPPLWHSGHRINIEVACRDSVYEALSALRPNDVHLLRNRIYIQFRRGERDSLAADCRRLEKFGHLGEAASVQLLRGDVREFERLRGSRAEDAYSRALRLGQAPTDEATTRRLVEAADELAKSVPLERWQRRWVGVAQLRAGRPAEAKASLLASLDSQSGWQFNCLPWSVLAMACHQLGEQEEAERWLHKAETWLNAVARVGPSELPRTMQNGTFFLNDWFIACLFYREAQALLHGPEAAARELAAVASPPHKASDPKVAFDLRVKSQLDRAVAAADTDPLPWIKRGRWHAEHGEHEKSDADFAKAASLTPNELHKFLAAGWWVIGPYPADLNEFCPPELNPDPSVPLRIVDPQHGLSDQTVPWRSVTSESPGLLNLPASPGSTAYAVAYVYSPEERTALIRVENLPAGTQALRLWFNAQPLTLPHFSSMWTGLDAARLPVSLRKGRNVLLVKAKSGTNFTIGLGDRPVDRAMLLVERRLWPEAVELLLGEAQDLPEKSWPMACELAKLAVLSGKEEPYPQLCADAYERSAQAGPHGKYLLGHVLSLAPNPVLAAHYDDVIRMVMSPTTLPAEPAISGRDSRCHLIATWAALQANRLPDAERSLAAFIASGSDPDPALPAQAMLAAKKGEHNQAARLLQQALAGAPPRLNTIVNLEFATTYLVQLRAAERTVTGSTKQCDALLQAAHERDRLAWDQADPLTAAFDHLVLTNKASNRAWPPGLAELARGEHLAELGRFTEAEVDFNTAVNLRPKNADVRAARAAFLAGVGRADEAATEYIAACECYTGEETSRGARQRLLLEIARRDDVFASADKLRADYHALWLMRLVHHIRQGDAAAALADAERVAALNPGGFDSLTALRLCGDAAVFEQRRESAPRSRDAWIRSWALGLAPTSAAQTTELLAAAGEQKVAARRDMGLALLRAGRLPEAVATLEASSSAANQWHSNVNVWPLLAIAEHQLGNKDRSRHWLSQCESVLQMHEQAAAHGRFDTITPTHALVAQKWLLGVVLYCEAKSLIDGTQFADEARALLARWALAAKERATAESAQSDAAAANAEAALRAAVQRNPADVAAWTRLGRFLADARRFDEAAASYAQSLAHQPPRDPAAPARQPGTTSVEILATEHREIFERLIKLRPKDRDLWIARSHNLAHRSQWQEALAAMNQAIELLPGDHNPWYWKSALLLALGDDDGFRSFSREFLARFATNEEPRVANRVLMTCLLLPDVLNGQQPAQAQLDQLVARIRKESPGQTPDGQRWDALHLGLADYRAGRFAEAGELLRQCLAPGAANSTRAGAAYFVLAMTQHRAGQSGQAQATLQAGLDFVSKSAPAPTKSGFLGAAWSDWVRMDTLRREAVALLGRQLAPAPAPPAPAGAKAR